MTTHNSNRKNDDPEKTWLEQNREQLRRLDDCLTILEDAQEQLEMTYVTEHMANLLRSRVPTIVVGMTIADAIEEVFRLQEPYMQRPPSQSQDRRKPALRKRHALDINTILGSFSQNQYNPLEHTSFFTRKNKPKH